MEILSERFLTLASLLCVQVESVAREVCPLGQLDQPRRVWTLCHLAGKQTNKKTKKQRSEGACSWIGSLTKLRRIFLSAGRSTGGGGIVHCAYSLYKVHCAHS